MPIKGTMEEIPDAVADHLLTEIVNELESDAMNDVTDDSTTMSPGTMSPDSKADKEDVSDDMNKQDEEEPAVKVNTFINRISV